MIASSTRRAVLIIEAETAQIESTDAGSSTSAKADLLINKTLLDYISSMYNEVGITFAHVATSDPGRTVMAYLDHLIKECA
eukprot:6159498-Amphidinium_carterae.1